MLPLYSNAPKYLINKLHKVIMTAARVTIGDYCFKKYCKYILDKCSWLGIEKMILFSGIGFTYKILTKREPEAILRLYKYKKK